MSRRTMIESSRKILDSKKKLQGFAKCWLTCSSIVPILAWEILMMIPTMICLKNKNNYSTCSSWFLKICLVETKQQWFLFSLSLLFFGASLRNIIFLFYFSELKYRLNNVLYNISLLSLLDKDSRHEFLHENRFLHSLRSVCVSVHVNNTTQVYVWRTHFIHRKYVIKRGLAHHIIFTMIALFTFRFANYGIYIKEQKQEPKN